MRLYWNAESGAELGGEHCRIRGTLFDANGLEWKRVTWCDTETGELEYFETSADGGIARGADGWPLRARATTAAPLRIVPHQ